MEIENEKLNYFYKIDLKLNLYTDFYGYLK